MATDPLRDELLHVPSAWRPEKGDVLIGEVTALEEREGFAGRPYPIVTVRTEAGEYVSFHAYHTVAMDELARQKPRVGDRLGVAYHGLVERGESRYELYRVKIVPAGGDVREPDWVAIQAQAEAEREAEPDPGDADLPF